MNDARCKHVSPLYKEASCTFHLERSQSTTKEEKIIFVGNTANKRRTGRQTWSSRDLSLGLETSRDPFLQVLVSVLVLEPQGLGLGLGLGLGTLESRSRSWSCDFRP